MSNYKDILKFGILFIGGFFAILFTVYHYKIGIVKWRTAHIYKGSGAARFYIHFLIQLGIEVGLMLLGLLGLLVSL